MEAEAKAEVKDEATSDPRKLITKDHVRAALKEDKGIEAQLITFEIQDFTNKGDNMATYVTSVKLNYSVQNELRDVIYVVKVNPFIPAFSHMTTKLFDGEMGFYMDVAPDMKSVLESSGQPALGIPEFFYGCKETGKQVIFLEDLRPRGFKMTDRKTGLDFAHASLVINELATFHSSSYLLIKRHRNDFANRYKSTKYAEDSADIQEIEFLNQIFKRYIACSKEILNKIGGYKKVIKWIQKHEHSPADLMYKMLKSSPPFDVVCHGDLWSNNMLFRYDEEGHPIEMMLVDLQITRLASLSSDLNHFFFCNLTGDVRQPNIHKFLDFYFETFSAVVEAGGEKMPFTRQELRQEFKNMHEYGLVYAMLVVPIVVGDSSESPEADDIFGVKSEEMEAKYIQKQTARLTSNPLLKSRFLSILQEMEQEGTFD